MTLVLALRIDADASGLAASAKIAREDLERLTSAITATGSAGGAAAGGLDRQSRSTGNVGAAAGQAAAGVERLARDFDALKGSLDPAYAALRRYEQEQLLVNQAVAAGVVTQQEAARTLSAASQRYQIAARGSVAGFRSAGAAAQQFGYQVGDLAVQVASGQNAVIALTQQGTQLLQAFGPWGSVIGAAAAIVGVLAVSLLEFETAAKKADTAQKALRGSLSATKDVIGDSADDILLLADRYKVATEAQRQLINSELATAIAANTKEIRDQVDALRDLAFDDVEFDAPIDDTGLQEAAVSIDDLASHFQITRDGARQLSQALSDLDADPTSQTAQALSSVLADLTATTEGDREALIELTRAVVEIARDLETAATETARLGEAQRLLAGDTDALTKTQRDRARELQREREEGRRLAKQRTEAIDELKLELRQIEALTLAHGQGREAVQRANVENDTATQISKLKLKADSEQAKSIGELIAKIQEKRRAEAAAETLAGLNRELVVQQRLTEAQRTGGRAIADAADAQKAYQEILRLGLAVKSDEAQAIIAVITAIEDEGRARQQLAEIRNLEDEIDHLEALAAAHHQGADAVAAVNAENRIRLTLAKLNLDADSEQGRQLAELIRQLEQQKLATKQVEEAAGAYRDVWSNAIEDVQKLLTDQVEDALAGNLESVEDWSAAFLSIVRRLAANLISQAMVIPVVVSGADAIGLGGFVPAAYRTAASAASGGPGGVGGGLGGGLNPLSFLDTRGLYNQFAFSNLGQTLGLSASSGAIAASSLGVTAATAPATLALSGPAGGFGTLAGIQTASTGGLAGAAGLGGAAPGLTSLGAAVPYIGLALAAASILGPMLFGGNPSVGPVGIADFSPGLGRDRAFDVPGIDPFTADNGGDGEALRPIAEAIADLIADSADRFSATIAADLRFRVARYQSPEGGSGREAGFEVNAFIRGEAEKRVAEGLSEEQAIYEALKFAISEAFTFESQTLQDIADTLTATTADELLGQLQTAFDFEDLTTALRANNGAINANTLARQEGLLALRRRGEDAGRSTADATLERFKTLADLFAAPEALAGLGRDGTPEPVVDTANLDALRAAPPDFDRGALRGGDGVVSYDQDAREITAGDSTYTLRSTGNEFGGLELVDQAGEVVGAFDSLSEALIGAAEAAETASQSIVPAVDEATRELYDRNLARIRDAIQITRADISRDIGRITGAFEEPKIGVYEAGFVEGKAALETYGDQLKQVNEAFRRQAEDFPELASEITAWLIDIPATINAAQAELRSNLAQRLRDDLDAEARQLEGFGAVDGIKDLIDTRDVRLTDASVLGVDATLVNRNFALAIGKAFEGLDIEVIREVKANVTDPVVRALADEAIAKRVTAFNQSIGDQLLALQSPRTAELVGLNRRYQEDLAFARDNGGDVDAVIRLYQEQTRRLIDGTDDLETALGNTVVAFTRVVPDLKKFAYELTTDPTLATETTQQRYEAIKARFEEIAEAAEGGDAEAQAELEAAGRELLQVSRLVNAANDNYAADRAVVMGAVNAAISKGESELQLAKDQLSALNGIDARLVELAQALSSGRFGDQPTSNLILAQASGYSGGFGGGAFQQAAHSYANSNVQGLGSRPDLNAQLAYVTGFTGSFGGGAFQAFIRGGSVSELRKEAARIILRANGEEPGFVDGGYVMNGTPGIDSVTARLAGREFVIKAPAVAQLGVPTLSYINETGRLPGADAGAMREVGQMVVETLRSEGEASRLQSRDDADHVADQVGRLHQVLTPIGQGEAHERARPGRAA